MSYVIELKKTEYNKQQQAIKITYVMIYIKNIHFCSTFRVRWMYFLFDVTLFWRTFEMTTILNDQVDRINRIHSRNKQIWR